MSVIRGGRGLKKKELIERVLRDLSPGLREEARRLLEEQDLSVLMDRRRLKKLIEEHGLL